MVKRVIIHGGFPKTGTSFIQKALMDNIDTVEQHGLHYPLYRGPKLRETTAGNHSLVFKGWSETEPVLNRINSLLDFDIAKETLLISAEAMVQIRKVDLFLKDLATAFPDAKIEFVFYVRRIDHWRESVHSEQVKSVRAQNIFAINTGPRFALRLMPFAVFAGRENVTIRPYNSKRWPDGSLGADFFTTIGMPDLWPAMTDTKSDRVNQSLSRSEIFLLSKLDTLEEKKAAMALLAEQPLVGEHKGRYFLSPEERRKVNVRIRGEYNSLQEVFDIDNIDEFLGLDGYDDDPHWQKFEPDMDQIRQYIRQVRRTVARSKRAAAAG